MGMSVGSKGSLMASGVLLAALACGPVQAATLSEAEAGGFSHDWAKPTVVTGVTSVSGTTDGGYDIFRFDLPLGSRSVSIGFSAGDRMGYSYSAGSTVMYSFTGFPWGWSGSTLGVAQIDWQQPLDDALTLTLDDAFAGTLFLALYNTHGVMNYTISGLSDPPARGEASAAAPAVPAPVPLPAGIVLLGSAVGAGSLIAWCKGLRRKDDPASS